MSALPIASMNRRITERSTSDSLGDVSWVQKLLYSCTEGKCHSSTRPGTSLHVTQFYQAFPHVTTASDNAGVRRPGYEATAGLETYITYESSNSEEVRTVAPYPQFKKSHELHKKLFMNTWPK